MSAIDQSLASLESSVRSANRERLVDALDRQNEWTVEGSSTTDLRISPPRPPIGADMSTYVVVFAWGGLLTNETAVRFESRGLLGYRTMTLLSVVGILGVGISYLSYGGAGAHLGAAGVLCFLAGVSWSQMRRLAAERDLLVKGLQRLLDRTPH